MRFGHRDTSGANTLTTKALLVCDLFQPVGLQIRALNTSIFEVRVDGIHELSCI